MSSCEMNSAAEGFGSKVCESVPSGIRPWILIRLPPMLKVKLVSGATVVTTYSTGTLVMGMTACVSDAVAVAGFDGMQCCKAGLPDCAFRIEPNGKPNITMRQRHTTRDSFIKMTPLQKVDAINCI